MAFLEEMEDPLPGDFDKTVICAHQREGAKSMVDMLIKWQPELVETADEN